MVFPREWCFLRTPVGQNLSRPRLIIDGNPVPRKFLLFTAHGHNHRHRSFSMQRLMYHYLTFLGLD